MNLLQPFADFLTRFGYIRPESFVEIDPALIPLLTNIANKEGLPLSDTIHQLLSFAVGEHHFTDENLALWHTLTNREKETAAFTCLGYTNHEIAQKMVISPNTVKTHLRRVLQKIWRWQQVRIAIGFSFLGFQRLGQATYGYRSALLPR